MLIQIVLEVFIQPSRCRLLLLLCQPRPPPQREPPQRELTSVPVNQTSTTHWNHGKVCRAKASKTEMRRFASALLGHLDPDSSFHANVLPVCGNNVRKDDDNVDFAPFYVGPFVFTLPHPVPEHANRGGGDSNFGHGKEHTDCVNHCWCLCCKPALQKQTNWQVINWHQTLNAKVRNSRGL